MSDKDQIKELFSDKLGGFEAKVNPELWTNIASQIGTTAATTASVGMSLATKIMIGVSAASVISVAAFLISNSEKEPKKKEVKSEQVSEVAPNNNEGSAMILIDGKEPQGSSETNVATSDKQNVELNASVPNDPEKLHAPAPITSEELQKSIIRLNTVFVENNKKVTTDTTKTQKAENKQENQGVLIEEKEDLSKTDQVEVPFTENVEEKLDLILPNVFTPNDDGWNEVLKMEVPENVTDFQITILNSEGKVVYQSDDPNFRWGGRHYLSGDKVIAGQYVYFVILKVGDNEPIEKSSYLKISY